MFDDEGNYMPLVDEAEGYEGWVNMFEQYYDDIFVKNIKDEITIDLYNELIGHYADYHKRYCKEHPEIKETTVIL